MIACITNSSRPGLPYMCRFDITDLPIWDISKWLIHNVELDDFEWFQEDLILYSLYLRHEDDFLMLRIRFGI